MKTAILGQPCLSHSGFGIRLLPVWRLGTGPDQRSPPSHRSTLQPARTLRDGVEVETKNKPSEIILEVKRPGLPLSSEGKGVLIGEMAGGRRK